MLKKPLIKKPIPKKAVRVVLGILILAAGLGAALIPGVGPAISAALVGKGIGEVEAGLSGPPLENPEPAPVPEPVPAPVPEPVPLPAMPPRAS